mmetsp:Transcript_40529/g.107090  ORF Transcript_40529/g.107090 Transcript_40529/m.107090 type:complete len:302 (+) Transcript_40529:1027-1932(+)
MVASRKRGFVVRVLPVPPHRAVHRGHGEVPGGPADAAVGAGGVRARHGAPCGHGRGATQQTQSRFLRKHGRSSGCWRSSKRSCGKHAWARCQPTHADSSHPVANAVGRAHWAFGRRHATSEAAPADLAHALASLALAMSGASGVRALQLDFAIVPEPAGLADANVGQRAVAVAAAAALLRAVLACEANIAEASTVCTLAAAAALIGAVVLARVADKSRHARASAINFAPSLPIALVRTLGRPELLHCFQLGSQILALRHLPCDDALRRWCRSLNFGLGDLTPVATEADVASTNAFCAMAVA